MVIKLLGNDSVIVCHKRGHLLLFGSYCVVFEGHSSTKSPSCIRDQIIQNDILILF